MSTRDPGRGRLIAVLGPTNTGKTHLAVERMLGHRSGMMGLPLRLLAREIYDRVAARIGKSEVALVTGEEKIQPRNARYFICTVEAMPLDRSVAFLCVDEIQLCGDPERGHVFTDRLLWARGGEETMFLGAETAKAVIRRLVPGIAAETRPRFSTLTYSGPRKLSRLKPRSAVVAFSAASVYAIAELLRRQRGGTALVMGALSPRTRNAQVALFQSGEVDYLVATDAIGMGLNMDVDHVAFAELVKFDGHAPRQLSAAEIGQIAGRAGRHMASGSFGTTAEAPDLDPDTIDRVENHRFETLKALYWRNPDLDFTSLPALIGSLGAPPPHDALRRAREADDEGALKMLATDREIADLARAPARLRLLWDVCRVPDFRKTSLESHVRLLGRLYRFLTAADERIPTDWIARQIAHLDRLDGDIDTLLARIAHVRTWTYVTHRGDWLADAEAWQERTRALEDRLSDALHDRLTQRFVDRHTAHLLRRLRDQRHLAAEVAPEGEVSLDGAPVGRLEGFRFLADAQPAGSELGRRAQRQAVLRGLAPVLAERVVALVESGADDFTLAPDATIAWRGARVAQLVPGPKVLAPRIDVLGQENLDTRQSEALRHRLATWLTAELRKRLAPLYRLIDADADGALRGLIYRLEEAPGAIPTEEARDLDRRHVARHGLRAGRVATWMPELARAEPRRLLGLLYSTARGMSAPPPPPPAAVWIAVDPSLPIGWYRAVGFWVVSAKAIRVDILERLAEGAHRLAARGAFAPTAELQRLAGGANAGDLAGALLALGYRPQGKGEALRFVPRRKRNPRPQIGGGLSPFAALRDLVRPRRG